MKPLFHKGRQEMQMRLVLASAVLLVLLAGCSSTRIVGGDVGNHRKSQLTYRQLQDRLRGKEVCVVLRDDRKFLGTISDVARDSVRLWSGTRAESVALSTREVWRIEKTDHVGGGILGFLGGIFGGLLLGAAIGEVAVPGGGDMRGLGVALYAVEGAGIGAVGGTIYGATHGTVNCYEFEVDSVAAGTP
jgi:hypothetical protein